MLQAIRRRLSPALVVSIIALVLALGGTSYAVFIPAGSVGSRQLAPNAVLNSKLKAGQVTSTKLAKNSVTFSKLANNQFTADKIRNGTLLGEDLKDGTITGSKLDLTTVGRSATVLTTNALATQSGGITISSQDASATVLDFGASMAAKPLVVSLVGTNPGQVTVAPCGGSSTANPTGVTCPTAVNNPNHVIVSTFNGAGAPAKRAFSILSPQG